jgi:hypothetical protein
MVQAGVAAAPIGGPPLAYMDAGTLNRDALALWNAVICVDCEVISNTSGDECPACKNRSVVGLARMLGGSLLVHKVQRSHECESVQYDVNITVELQQIHARDLTTTIERLTNVIGPMLMRGRASFHVNVDSQQMDVGEPFRAGPSRVPAPAGEKRRAG